MVREEVPSILGADACHDMGLISFNPSVCPLTIGCDFTHHILTQYKDLFNDMLGKLPVRYTITIDPEAIPVVRPAHKIPNAMRDRVQSELNRMMALGVITPVTEALDWVSSMLVATKKNKGEIRICINPKDLNTAIKRPRYPMHLVGKITAQMADANVLTVLDAKSSFCQILLEHKSSKLTPFSTPFGRYKCLRMPFGISSAS